MSKTRKPTNKLSWIGMAAHEIDEISNYGASRAASLARGLAEAIIGMGRNLLDLDPRVIARLNYSPEAIAARIEAERAACARSRQRLGEDDICAWLTGRAPTSAST